MTVEQEFDPQFSGGGFDFAVVVEGPEATFASPVPI